MKMNNNLKAIVSEGWKQKNTMLLAWYHLSMHVYHVLFNYNYDMLKATFKHWQTHKIANLYPCESPTQAPKMRECLPKKQR